MLEVKSIEEQTIDLESLKSLDRIAWAYENFSDKLVVSTSFGIQSPVMLHLATSIYPQIPVIFIDTGYLFADTYRYARELCERFNINLEKYHPLMSAAEQESLNGRLWEQGEDSLRQYNFTRKIEPMNRALVELEANAWMVGLRRDQAKSRQSLNVIKEQNNILKFHPIIDWNDGDIDNYMQKHNLPYHPLKDARYVSLGDWHSTSKLKAGMISEETRFNGVKRECGLHESTNIIDFQI